eukprot:sb/3477982/
MNFRIFDKKSKEKVTKKLIQIAPIIFILTTITVLTAQLANPWNALQSPRLRLCISGKTLKSGCLSLLTIRSFSVCDELGLSVRVWLGFGLWGSVRAIDFLSDAV